MKKAYPEPKEKPKDYYIMYHRPWTWFSREGLEWDSHHGFKFEEGVVHRVSELVCEWSKRQKGFFEVKRVDDGKLVKFK